MIIDVLQSQRSVIKVSHYDNPTCDKIKTGSLSVLEGEPLQWTITDPSVTNATITIDFIDTVRFEDLLFDFSIPADIQIFYSHDGKSWNEFNYFTYSIASYDLSFFDGNENERRVMVAYSGKTIKVDYVSMRATTVTDSNGNIITVPAHIHRNYTIYDPLTERASAISSDDYQILLKYLEKSFTVDSNTRSQYVFRVVDAPSETNRSIFRDLDIRHIQLRLSNFDTTGAWRNPVDPTPTPLTMNRLQILASVDINIDDTYLTTFSGALYQQRFFEEYPFIPSIANSFFEMLESSDKEIVKTPTSITVDFKIDEANSKLLFDITSLTLGEFFDPVFVWTIGPAGNQQRYVYKQIPVDGVWAEVDRYLAMITDASGVISKVTDLSIDFAIITLQFHYNRTIKYDLSKPHTGVGWLAQ